jgi:hypothetical protein
MSNIIISEIKFSFADWENKSVQAFRDNIEKFIGLQHARTSVLLSTDLNKNGVSFFLLTTDGDFAGRVQATFGMRSVSNIDTKSLGIEYGNQDLIIGGHGQ